MKEFWKSINIWQTEMQKYNGNFFMDTVYNNIGSDVKWGQMLQAKAKVLASGPRTRPKFWPWDGGQKVLWH